jgi:hypothetical protein
LTRKGNGFLFVSSLLEPLTKDEHSRTGYARIGLAFTHGKGVRLSAREVEQLIDLDDAIARAIYNIMTDDERIDPEEGAA